MKNIVVIYTSDDWEKEIPFMNETTRLAFEDWHERGLKKDYAFFRACIHWYDPKTGTFSKAWAYRDKKWIRVDGPLHPDGVYDKTPGKENARLLDIKMEMLSRFPVVNHPFFNLFFDNKFSHSLVFGEYMPQTLLAHDLATLQEALQKIPGEKIVLKPVSGSGGQGVFILEKAKVLAEAIVFPVLAQEFLSAYKGIPGFSEEENVADLRLVYIGGKLCYALSRVAQKNSLLTNFHQGARAVLVPNERIPESAMLIAQKIVKRLSLFPKNNTSLDFMFDEQKKPYLIEINTKPGFDLLHLVGDDTLKEEYFEAFCTLF